MQPMSIQHSLSQAKADPSIAWARFLIFFIIYIFPLFYIINIPPGQCQNTNCIGNILHKSIIKSMNDSIQLIIWFGTWFMILGFKSKVCKAEVKLWFPNGIHIFCHKQVDCIGEGGKDAAVIGLDLLTQEWVVVFFVEHGDIHNIPSVSNHILGLVDTFWLAVFISEIFQTIAKAS